MGCLLSFETYSTADPGIIASSERNGHDADSKRMRTLTSEGTPLAREGKYIVFLKPLVS